MEKQRKDDFDIIRRVLQGEVDVYEELINRYQAKVCSICYSVVYNYDDAMDLSQEVFIRAYENLKKFNGRSSFYTWLYRIAKNIAIDFKRKHGKFKNVELVEGIKTSISENKISTPRDDIDMQELNEIITSTIEELPEEQKEVIILREINGLSYNEIAEALKCSQGTVMSRLHYARKKLAERLKNRRFA